VTHCTEDDLVLYHYGESSHPARIERHLNECASCAALHRAIAGTLSIIVEPGIPERGDHYGLEVWHRIRHQLPPRDTTWWPAWLHGDRLAEAGMAAAICAAVAGAFVAGRLWGPGGAPAGRAGVQANHAQAPEAQGDGDARVRLAAISDHLERSERVLLDLVNLDDVKRARSERIDVTDEQVWAADLVDTNRLYRQAAAGAGDTMVAAVLDDLERHLLDIVHGPSALTPAQLENLRVRLDAAALLFKVRVLHDELRERERAAAAPDTTPVGLTGATRRKTT
jgi:hypothetical protein